MARSVIEIQQSILDQVSADATLSGSLTSTSKVALWRLSVYVWAFCAFALETLFDTFKSDTNTELNNRIPHTARWYANMGLLYQHGRNLIAESDKYDNTGLTDADIENERVVKYSAVSKIKNEFGRITLRIKLAGSDGSDLKPLEPDQLAGVKEYFDRVQDAGDDLDVTSGSPDGVRLNYDIYYDPLILSANGIRLDGTSQTPVQDAIKSYLMNLSFNGVFVLQYLNDQVEAVEGVTIANLNAASAQYGLLPYSNIVVKYIPDAGYLRLLNDTDLQLNFIPQSRIK